MEELGYLVQVGLSPYDALRAGTHDAALALGKLAEFGAVAEGKRADQLVSAYPDHRSGQSLTVPDAAVLG